MGNQNSAVLGTPSQELKFKAGVKSEPVPSPAGALSSTFEKLISSVNFKNYLLSHLDSSYFVSSLIQHGADDAILLQGIRHFQNLDPELRAETVSYIAQFQRLSSAGVCATTTESISICEKELSLRSEMQASPFTKSLQYRIAAIRNLAALVARERSLQVDEVFPPDFVTASISTNNTAPLHYLLPMQNAGFSMLELLSVFLPTITDTVQKDLLRSQLVHFCDEIQAIPSLSLFSSWSPRCTYPMKAVPIIDSSVKASNGDPARAIDGSTHTCWAPTGNRAEWTVDLEKPTRICSIRICWASPPTASISSPSGAPKKLTILFKKGVNKPFELACSINMDSEKTKHSSWVHAYTAESSDVCTIKLVLSGTRGPKSPFKMYSFEALSEDLEAKCVNPLQTLNKIQSLLCKLVDIDTVQLEVLKALPVAARSTGSLEIVLDLIRFIRLKGLDAKIRENASAEIYALLQSVHAEEEKVRDMASGNNLDVERVLTDVVFDETAKSSGIEVNEGGMMIGCLTGGNSYGLLTCVMDTGVWEWEMTLVRENQGDETSCLGVARRPVTNYNYDSTEDMWLIRCYNGETYHKGRTGRKTLPTIHPSDICRFTYDTASQMVMLTLNEVDQGIVFENVPPGVSPAVAFYGSGKTVRLLMVKQKGGTVKPGQLSKVIASKIDAIDSKGFYAGEDELASVEELFGKQTTTDDSAEVPKVKLSDEESSSQPSVILNPSTLILKRVSHLARLQSVVFQSAVDNETAVLSRSLEYPYAVQVTTHVFEMLMDLLSSFESTGDQDSKFATLSCLHIIDAQFACLNYSKIDPELIGLGATKGKACNSMLSSLVSRLRFLIKSNDAEIQKAAAETFSRGIPFIFPNIAGRVEFALSVLREMNSPDSNESVVLIVSKTVLLKAIIRRLSRYSETLQLLNLFKRDPAWRGHIIKLVFSLIDMVAEYSLFCSLGSTAVQGMYSKIMANDPEFHVNVMSMLKKFQEQIIYDLATSEAHDLDKNYSYCCTVGITARYVNKILSSGANVLKTFLDSRAKGVMTSDICDLPSQDTLFIELVCPVLHSCCLNAHHIEFVCEILPGVNNFLSRVSDVVAVSPRSQSAQKLLCDSLSTSRSTSFPESSGDGWRTVNAVFEEVDPTYSITDSGCLYTSVQSSNTCALLNTGFSSPQRAAWEFLLEHDTNSDECAVFGISTRPIVSRCYSSSSNLWMRRCYNGYLYAQGRSTGQTLDKIHPNDIIRVEFDGKAGTLSFSVNSGPLEVAFTGLTGEIFPCCGSYRTGVKVRLLKVEVYGSPDASIGVKGSDRAPEQVHFEISEEFQQGGKPNNVLCPAKSLSGLVVEKKDEPVVKEETWVTARGDRGAAGGVHEWSFEILERSKTSMCFGVISGGLPYPRDRLGGPCYVAEVRSVARKLVNTSKGPRYYCGRRGVGYYAAGTNRWCGTTVCSCDGVCGPTNGCQCEDCYKQSFPSEFTTGSSTAEPATVPTSAAATTLGDALLLSEPPVTVPVLERGSRSSSEAGSNSSRRLSPVVSTASVIAPSAAPAVSSAAPVEPASKLSTDGMVQEISDSKRELAFSYGDAGVVAMGWCTDGSLWINGEKRANGFGKAHFPADKFGVVTVRVDRIARTVSYFVNGAFVGVAFGPTGSGAVVEVPLCDVDGETDSEKNIVYPAASVASYDQSVRIRASGFFGSIVLPTFLYLQKTCASVVGRLASSLIVGPPLTAQEDSLEPWLKSPLFVGGLDSNLSMNGDGDKDDRAVDWNHAWLNCVSASDIDADISVGRKMTLSNIKPVPATPGLINISMQWIDGIVYSSDSSVRSLTLALSLLLGSATLDSSEITLALQGNDVDWSSCPDVNLRFLKKAIAEPLKLDVRVMVNKNGGISELLCSSVIDISCELSNEKALGSYFVPATPAGIFSVLVNHVQFSPDQIVGSIDEESVSKIILDAEEYASSSVGTSSIFKAFGDLLSEDGQFFIDWLERITPEPAMLRRVLQKSGQYSFPIVERPLVACLLKHGSLVSEAESVFSCIEQERNRLVSQNAVAQVSDMQLPQPSSDMASLWKRVQQFRLYLRSHKQQFKAGLEQSKEEVLVADEKNLSEDEGTSPQAMPTSSDTPSESAAGPTAPSSSIETASETSATPSGLFFVSQRSILWQIQPENTKCTFTQSPASHYCSVISVGVDPENEVAYVKVRARAENFSNDVHRAGASRLTVGGVTISASANHYISESSREIVGYLRYDLFSVSLKETQAWKFTFGTSGYEEIVISPPDLNGIGTYMPDNFEVFCDHDSNSLYGEQNSDTPSSFEELCLALRSKILFLLRLTPAGTTGDPKSDENSKSILLNLTEKYADMSSGPTKLLRWRSDEGEVKKWKNMFDILHVHSRIRRQNSSERLGLNGTPTATAAAIGAITGVGVPATGPEYDSAEDARGNADPDDELQIDDLSPSEAAMQACTVFIKHSASLNESSSDGSSGANTDTVSSNGLPSASAVKGLYAAIRKRTERAHVRRFGMGAINQALNMENIKLDPFAVEEILMFLRPSFDSDILRNCAPDRQNTEKKSPRRLHYLVNLEGCNALTLAGVQESFLEMFSSLFYLLQEYLYKWKVCSEGTSSLLKPSSASRGYVLSESLDAYLKAKRLGSIYLGPMRFMMAAWSLHFSGRDHRFLLKSNVIPCLQKIFSLSEYEQAVMEWTNVAGKLITYLDNFEALFPDGAEGQFSHSDYVRQGLKSGSVSCRSILFRMNRIPRSLLPEADLVSLRLERKNFVRNCNELGPSEVSLLYEQVCALVSLNKAKAVALKEQQAEKETTFRLKCDKSLRQHLKETKVPYFDKRNKNEDAILSGGDTVVTSEPPKAGSNFDVRCAFADVEYNFVRGDEKTGNYFECTILNIGDRDIGIGLAVKSSFPVKGQMPGWVDNSYGHHGDDGNFFGRNNCRTAGPKWNVGDVIGCGVNFENRSIFFTRNGAMIGIGFTDVNNDVLQPVVGFHCKTKIQSLRINFGLYPFHYSGPEVKGHPMALAQREWFSEWCMKHQVSLACPKALISDGSRPPLESSTLSFTSPEEEKAELEIQETKDSGNDDHLDELIPRTSDEYLRHLKILEKAVDISSDYLIQFNSLRRYSDAFMRYVLATSNSTESGNGSSDLSAVSPVKQPLQGGNDTSTLNVDDLPGDLPPPALMKGRSTFGTPKSVTAEDGALLQQNILGVIIQDILVGAIYLSQAFGTGSQRENNSREFYWNAMLHPPSKSVTIADIISRIDEYIENKNAKVRMGNSKGVIGGVLEINELERILYEHLTTLLGLCSVIKILVKEISRPVSVKALLVLLRIGSPRLQNASCRLLRLCVPSLAPQVVDACLQEDLWRDSYCLSDSGEADDSSDSSRQKRKLSSRQMPDSFVKGLVNCIRLSVSIGCQALRRREVPKAPRSASVNALGSAIETGCNSAEVKDAELSEISSAPAESGDGSVAPPSKIKRRSSSKLTTTANMEFKLVSLAEREHKQFVPFGYGEVTIDVSDQFIELIQVLFESPLWTEVVACVLTDVLREAVQILKRFNGNQSDLSPLDVITVEQACAVCAILSGLGSLHPGGAIQLSDGSQGMLISKNIVNGTADIMPSDFLLSTSNAGFQSGSVQHIETVPLHSITAQPEGVKVALGELSQPLVQLLTALMKQSLIWFHQHAKNKKSRTGPRFDSGFSSLIVRLSSMSSNAFSLIMEKQYFSVADVAQDSALITDITGVSLLPGGLNIFPTMSEVNRMWLFMQSRVVESMKNGRDDSQPQKEIEIVDSEPVADEEPVTVVGASVSALRSEVIISVHPHPLILTDADNGWGCDGRTAFAATGGCVSGCTGFRQSSGWTRYRCGACDFDLCGRCVDTYAPAPPVQEPVPEPSVTSDPVVDVAVVASTETAKVEGSVVKCDHCVFMPEGSSISMEERIRIAQSLQEKYGLVCFPFCLSVVEYFMCDEKRTEEYVSNHVALVKRMDADWSSAKSRFMYRSRVTIDPDNVLKQIDIKLPSGSTASKVLGSSSIPDWESSIDRGSYTLSPCELARVVKEPSSSKSEAKDKTSRRCNLHVGELICVSDLEGLSTQNIPNIGRVVTSSPSAAGVAIISTYDRDLGITFCETNKPENLRRISAFYERSLIEVSDMSSELDMTLTILRMRNITAKLLSEGGVSFSNTSESIKDWLGLLKLSCNNPSAGSMALDPSPMAGSVGYNSKRTMFETLAPLCTALISTSRAYPADAMPNADSDVVDVLISDVLEGLDLLMNTSNIADPTRSSEQPLCLSDSDLHAVYSSTHPFVAENDVAGTIKIPSSWEGAVVTFDSRCSIPSNAAELSFYKNVKDYDSKKSAWGFNGKAADADKFFSLVFPSKEPICFRFLKKKSTFKSKVGLKSIYGTAKLSSDGLYKGLNKLNSLASSAEFVFDESSGLGYQLLDRKRYVFEPDAEILKEFEICEGVDKKIHIKLLFPQDMTLAMADGPPLKEGVWFFEVAVDRKGKGSTTAPDSAAGLPSDLSLSVADTSVSYGSKESLLVLKQSSHNMIGLIDVSEHIAGSRLSAMIPEADQLKFCCFLTSNSNLIVARGISGSEYMDYSVEPLADLGSWTQGDVIGCLFQNSVVMDSTTGEETVESKVRFSRNGVWCDRFIVLPSGFPNGAYPATCIKNGVVFQANFGGSKFLFPPKSFESAASKVPTENPSLARLESDVSSSVDVANVLQFLNVATGVSEDVPAAAPVPAAPAMEAPVATLDKSPSADSATASSAPPDDVHIDYFGISSSSELSNPRLNEVVMTGSCLRIVKSSPIPSSFVVQSNQTWMAPTQTNELPDWGYRFKVQPLIDINIHVSRDFELVYKSESKEFKSDVQIYIWKATSIPSDFCNCYQIATNSPRPPVGCIIMRKSMCKAATSFKQLFTSATMKFTVWRPQPPPGFVALGDIVATFSSGSASATPSTDSFLCVPLSAVKPCHLGQRIFKCDKAGEKSKPHKCSFWGINNELGAFMGSASDHPEKLGDTYKLNLSAHNIIRGEWLSETDALELPSLSWTCALLEFLLSNKLSVKKTLLGPIFESLVNYLQCNVSIHRLRIVPLIIKMIRSSREMDVSLPFDLLENCSKSILKAATAKVPKEKTLGEDLLYLVDLVVELVSVDLSRRCIHPTIVTSYSVSNYDGLLTEDNIEESKEEIGDGIEFKEAEETDAAVVIRRQPILEKKVTLDSAFSQKCSSISYPDWAANSYYREGDIAGDNYQIDWWSKSFSDDEKLKHRITDASTDMEKMLKKTNVMYGLRLVMGFLNSFSGNDRNSATSSIRKSIPFGLLMKAWFEHASSCVVEESAHPYPPLRRSYKKRVHFPGASALSIVFDSRCSLNTATLTLSYISTKTKQRVSQILKGGITGNWPRATLDIAADYVDVEFSPSTISDGDSNLEVAGYSPLVQDDNKDGLWGWSFVVHAVGPIFEASGTKINLSEYVRSDVPSPIRLKQPGVPDGDETFLSSDGSFNDPAIAAEAVLTSEKVINDLVAVSNAGGERHHAIQKYIDDLKASMADSNSKEKDNASEKPPASVLLRRKLVLVAAIGQKISSGNIGVPHAQQIELTIDRPNPKEASASLIYAMHLQYLKDTEVKEEYVVIDKSNKKIKVNNSSATYAVYCLPENMVPVVELEKVETAVAEPAPVLQVDVGSSGISSGAVALSESKGEQKIDVQKVEVPAVSVAVSGVTSAAVADLGRNLAETSLLSTEAPILGSTEASAGSAAGITTTAAASTTAVVAATDLPAAPPAPAAAATATAMEAPVGVEAWGCNICTFLNDLESHSCVMCGMPREAGGEAGSDDGGVEVPEEAAVAAWWCPRCTFMNPLSRSTCEMCGGPSGSPSAPAAAPAAAPAEHGGEEEEEEEHEEEEEDQEEEDGEDSEESDHMLEALDDDEDEEEAEDHDDEGAAGGLFDGDPELPPPPQLVRMTTGTISSHAHGNENNEALSASAAVPSVPSAPDTVKSVSVEEETVKKPLVAVEVALPPDVLIITAKATKFTDAGKCESRLEQSMISGIWTPVEFMQRMFYNWDDGADTVILDFIDSQKSSKKITDKVASLVLPRSVMDYKSQGFSRYNILEVQCRILLISYFNSHIEEILPMINLKNADPMSLGAQIRQRSRYIFSHIKQPMLESELEATATPSGPGVPASFSLDNFKALHSREKNECEPTNSNCIFVQGFKELQKKDSNVFRHIFSGDRVFQIQFVGESGIDAGGVFREGVMRMVEDLFSEHFNLLLLCPNGVHSVHVNMEKFVPNPRHTSALALQMFEFMGKLMGMSLRVKLLLPFELPSLVWKQLVGQEVVLDDLMAIDLLTCKYLDAVRNCEADGITDQASFEAKYKDRLKFVYTSSDGVERELVKGGQKILVTYATRLEYCNLVINARLSEFNKQVAAIGRGMAEVVPMRVLQLFSWQQLETLVVGSATFDIELWKRHTDSSGISSKCLSLFWKVIESMTPKEQAGFVRFAWGRSRLPPAKDFKTKMKLTPAGSAPLPVAHTCFFSVELPDYPTEDKMRHGLMTAIHFGAGGILMG